MKTKTKKPFSKVLAGLLSFALAFTMLPSMAFAAEADPVPLADNDGLVLSKTATLEEDGTYTINLEAYATGETTTTEVSTPVPLDVVLVIDQSGSMYISDYLDPLKAAVTNFVNTISDNAKENDVDHRVALVGYASDNNDGESTNGTISPGSSEDYWINTGLFIDGTLKNYGSSSKSDTTQLTAQDYQDALVSVNTNGSVTTSITTAIGNIAASGGTRTSYGMEMANQVFANNSDETRQRIVVVFTDGEPGQSGYDETEANKALAQAYVTKNTYGATVYTVGLYSDASTDVTYFMNYLSSNYPTAQSMPTITYDYTQVYESSLNQDQAYYVRDGGSYIEVTYGPYTTSNGNNGGHGNSGNGSTTTTGWHDSNNRGYTPKANANDRNNTQFYTRTETITGGSTSADTKYYMTTSSSGELDNIFSTIAGSITTPSTNVKLDASSVLRDVLADGFTLTEDSEVTVKTVAGSVTDADSPIVWGTEANPTDVTYTLDIATGTVDVIGFNYSEKYIAPSHEGEKLCVTITGVLAKDSAVQDEVIATNNEAQSGIYANANAETPVKTFPVPQTYLESKTYVLDYAKTAQLLPSDVTGVDSADDELMNAIDSTTSLNGKYGSLSFADGGISYTPKTTNWDGYDSFYVFGTKDGIPEAADANEANRLWSKVSVIPANNVYYEDDFETNDSGTVGIEYTGDWKVDGNSSGNTETANTDVHGGWENGSLADDAGYSDGSAHKAGADATATFTFTGTGVDVYSKTDMKTGTVVATLTKEGEKVASKFLIVDNYSANGEYYQIPTVFFNNLDYGTYTVNIIVTNAAGADRCTYYLDGIRVYNPIQDLESKDSTVQDAYGDELNATFTTVRDILIENASQETDMINEGNAVLIDQKDDKTGVETSSLADYKALGPKNEVYLAAGQSLAIPVSDPDAKYWLGIKAPQGSTSVKFAEGQNASITEIAHSTDLYYTVKAVQLSDSNYVLYIENSGEKLLAVTKLRTNASATSTASYSVESLLTYANTFASLPSVEYTGGKEEVTDPDSTVTEPTTPDESGEVIIDNPEPETKPVSDLVTLRNLIKKLFDGFRILLGR